LLQIHERAGEPVPEPGQRFSVLDSEGQPAAVIEFVQLRSSRLTARQHDPLFGTWAHGSYKYPYEDHPGLRLVTASLPAPLIAPVLLGGGVRKRRAAIGETAPDLARARSGMTGCAYGAGGLGLVSHHGRVGDEGVSVIGWIREIVMDTSDPWRLARFWAGLLGGMPVERYPGWVTLEPPPHGQRLSFQGTGDDSAHGPARPLSCISTSWSATSPLAMSV